jgi:hypothetical protein
VWSCKGLSFGNTHKSTHRQIFKGLIKGIGACQGVCGQFSGLFTKEQDQYKKKVYNQQKAWTPKEKTYAKRRSTGKFIELTHTLSCRYEFIRRLSRLASSRRIIYALVALPLPESQSGLDSGVRSKSIGPCRGSMVKSLVS